MLIRVAKNPHRSQQRLGFIKYLTYKVSQNDTTPIKVLGADLLRAITKKINTELDDSLRIYIEHRSRNQFRNIPQNQPEKIYLELQDLYLADPKIPSKTGKLYLYDCQKRYPYLLSSIGFAREKTYSLLVRGKVFLEFVPREELDVFTNYTRTSNPFLLNDYQKYICLYSILENDGDVLKPLYARLLNLKSSFSDWFAGDFLPEIYTEITKRYSPRVASGVDKQKLDHLSDSAKRIERWVNKPRTGGRGAKIDAITPRLEPFVDLRLLKKQNPYKYEYCFSEQGKEFFNLFCLYEGVDKFLDDFFFSTLNKSFKLKGNSAKKDEIIEILLSVFDKIKSPLGYAPIKEIALFGATKSLVDNKRYFEIGQATKLIMEYQKSHPYAARFQVDRSGAPVYVKFLDKRENRV
jgi:hypothetical protein